MENNTSSNKLQNNSTKMDFCNLTDLQKELLKIPLKINLEMADPLLVENYLKELFAGKISKHKLIEAIKEGSGGRFGSSYRLDFQEISRWVYRKIEDDNKLKRGSI